MCKFLSDPKRGYKNLPYKKCLSGSQLRQALDKIFAKQAQNASQLCSNSTSNPNESFNTMVASKAPKSHHYSKSESLDYRIAAAVCQKNMGEGYLCIVNEIAGMSPGRIAVESSCRKEKSFRKRKMQSSSKESKRRRLALKQSRFEHLDHLSLREGVTYETSVSSKPITEEDIEEIPQATSLSPIQTVPLDQISTAEICVFDLETTSLSRDCDIVQISAMTLDGRSKFDRYILPSKDVAYSASKVTGITMTGGKLFLHGKPVASVCIKEALSSFVNWLSSFGKHIILAGHNVKAFDVKHLLRHAKLHGISFDMLAGFVDTLPLSKHVFPEFSTYSQKHLFQKIIGGTYEAHNSLSDVIALCSLIKNGIPGIDSLQKFSYTFEWCKEYVTFLEERDKNVQTFHSLIVSKVISKGLAEKAASSGLSYRHLQIAFKRQGESGLKSLLGEKFNGKVRVSKSVRVISSILEYIKTENP